MCVSSVEWLGLTFGRALPRPVLSGRLSYTRPCLGMANNTLFLVIINSIIDLHSVEIGQATRAGEQSMLLVLGMAHRAPKRVADDDETSSSARFAPTLDD